MMFERFSRPAREVVATARQEAEALGHRHFGTEHLLLALVSGTGGGHDALVAAGVDRALVAAAIADTTVLGAADADALKSVGIDLDAVLSRITESFGPDALRKAVPGRRRGRVGVSPRVKKVLELALREAVHLGHQAIGTEHILLGILRDGSGRAFTIITGAGVDPVELRRTVVDGFGKAA
ncbi:ATP-dependent Clp protease ATP-binding subunit ClpC [Kutzneria sp. 744]|nr:ATP-dependent Clp protease ATP-binding subunit ClpC [Kutzneria sp. 744]